MNLRLTIGVSLSLLLLAGPAMAQNAGRWIVRAGPTLISPNDDSSSVSGIDGSGVSVDSAYTLGLTIGYMATENVSVELLGVLPPTSHDINGEGVISGLDEVGEVTVLPPTLTANYHFNPQGSIRPYAGVGINYTYFYGGNASSSLEDALGGKTDIDLDDSWGWAAQAGVDVDITPNVFGNLSVWYVDIDTEATLKTGSVKRTVDVEIDPWVVMVGVGTRF